MNTRPTDRSAGRVRFVRVAALNRSRLLASRSWQITTRPGVFESTVSTHAVRIDRKLGVTRRAQLALRMHALGEG